MMNSSNNGGTWNQGHNPMGGMPGVFSPMNLFGQGVMMPAELRHAMMTPGMQNQGYGRPYIGAGGMMGAVGGGAPGVWCPRASVAQNESGFLVCCELPGCNEKDIQVICHNGCLTIQGEKFSNDKDFKHDLCCGDRVFGKFCCSIGLSGSNDGLDVSKISMKFCDGVLQVSIPCSSGANCGYRKINVTK